MVVLLLLLTSETIAAQSIIKELGDMVARRGCLGMHDQSWSNLEEAIEPHPDPTTRPLLYSGMQVSISLKSRIDHPCVLESMRHASILDAPPEP